MPVDHEGLTLLGREVQTSTCAGAGVNVLQPQGAVSRLGNV